jgi:hypothetical protein
LSSSKEGENIAEAEVAGVGGAPQLMAILLLIIYPSLMVSSLSFLAFTIRVVDPHCFHCGSDPDPGDLLTKNGKRQNFTVGYKKMSLDLKREHLQYGGSTIHVFTLLTFSSP